MKVISRFMGVLLFLALAILAAPQIQYIMNGGYEEESSTKPTLEAGLSDEQAKFLYDVGRLINYAEQQGYKITSGEIYRTLYQQRENVRKGVSWTYNSKHLKRLAIDLNLFKDGHLANKLTDYCDMGTYWESLSPHNRWGGRFRDSPHFERMPYKEVSSSLEDKGICRGQ